MINSDVWIEAGRLAEQGRPFCLVIVELSKGSVPRRAGSAMLVRADGSSLGTIGGGSIERTAREEALAVLRENTPRTREFDLNDPHGHDTGSLCGGMIRVLYAPQPARMTLHLFGAGHVARPLCRLAAITGYAVIVYDETDEWATRPSFPDAAGIRTGDLAELAGAIEPGPADAVAILTGSHDLDYRILTAFRDRMPPYLGIIASKHKARAFRAELAKDGWPEDEIAHIHAPIGLEIGSRTPAEIALSIVAEIIRERGPVE